MIQEFEGKTEKEAIDKAVKELSLDQEEFDVEIVEAPKKGGLFRKGMVKIRVHVNEESAEPEGRQEEDDDEEEEPARPSRPARRGGARRAAREPLSPESDVEKEIVAFIEGVIAKMGYSGKVAIQSRSEGKLAIGIDSEHSSILIGKKGKNLDALQLLANVYAGKIDRGRLRIVVDTEGYRSRREDSLVRLARQMAEQVRRNRGSRLLEPMNPFERRLIHTTLNGLEDIDTKSEGEGLYKQVRVIYRGPSAPKQGY